MKRRRTRVALGAAAILAALLLVLVLTQSGSGGPIAVTLDGNLATTLDPANLAAETGLERQIAALPGVRTVAGPGTFLAQQVQRNDRLIRHDLVGLRTNGVRNGLAMLLVRLGYDGIPSADNSSFVGQVIYGSGTGPRRSLRSLFPDADHALIIARLRDGLGGTQAVALDHRIARLVDDAELQGVAAHVTVGLP